MTEADTSPAASPAELAMSFGLVEQLVSGKSLTEALGMAPLQSPKAQYRWAYTLYGQAKYAQAMRVFFLLMANNQMDRRYHFGFAACLHMQGQHAQAIKHYHTASMLDLTDPAPVMHCAECFLAGGEKEQARLSLDYALTQARAHARHHHHVPRLEAMTAFLDAAVEPTAAE